jgi:16S rRNA (cytosine1402-N4)-methyltransferase
VLVDEVVELFGEVDGLLVDGTVGLGGHALALLRDRPSRRLIAIDRDEEALRIARDRLAEHEDRVRWIHANFAEIDRVLRDLGEPSADGVLFDIGVSSLQLDRPARGFSFRDDGPLDMRMDRSVGTSARDWLRDADESDIADVLFRFGEERHARRIARAIARARDRGTIETTGELARIIREAVGAAYRGQRIDPATRTFQAIRIRVNDELTALERGLESAFSALAPGGLLVVISFHSLEDRIVKGFFRHKAASCVCPPDLPACVCDKEVEAEILTRRPIVASEAEQLANPRARSAKLRAATKVVR